MHRIKKDEVGKPPSHGNSALYIGRGLDKYLENKNDVHEYDAPTLAFN